MTTSPRFLAFTAALAAAAALSLTACGSGTGTIGAGPGASPSADATTNAPSEAPTTDAAATPSVSPTCGDLTAQQAIDRWLPEVPEFRTEGSAAGDTPWIVGYQGTGDYDPCAELSWIPLDIEGATGGSPSAAMLFHRGEYVGTATDEPYPYLMSIERTADDAIAVVHAWSAPDDLPPAHTWAATATAQWDETAGEVRRGGETPPVSDAEREGRHRANLATGLPEKINGIYPGAGGPPPSDVIHLGGLSKEERATLADPMVNQPDLVAMFRTTSSVGIGCSFHELGDVLCAVDAMYPNSPYGYDEEFGDPRNIAHFSADGTVEIIGFPDAGAWNMEGISTPTVQNGEPVQWGDVVCAMADDAVTCWNIETGHGAYVGGNRISRF